MTPFINTLKRMYGQENITLNKIQLMLEQNIITQEEYEYIIRVE